MTQGSSTVLFFLLALCTPIVHTSCGSEKPRPETLRHVVVIGASASAGYGTRSEDGAHGEDVALAEVLRVMIRSKEGRVTDASDALFLIAPESTGAEQAEKARESNPSCVIAIDYLYWLAQGSVGSTGHRQSRLAKGLKNLEDFGCPVLISELPQLHRPPGREASTGGAPSTETLEALNRSIVTWAAARTNAMIVPLKNKLADLYENDVVVVGSNSWSPPEAVSEILQSDGRHPTIAGLGMIAALCLESLIERNLVSVSEVDLDARAAVRHLLNR